MTLIGPPINAEHELTDKIRDTICAYWQEHKESDIGEIDIILRCDARHSPSTYVRKNFFSLSTETIPSFSAAEMDDVLDVLQSLVAAVEATKL